MVENRRVLWKLKLPGIRLLRETRFVEKLEKETDDKEEERDGSDWRREDSAERTFMVFMNFFFFLFFSVYFCLNVLFLIFCGIELLHGIGNV